MTLGVRFEIIAKNGYNEAVANKPMNINYLLREIFEFLQLSVSMSIPAKFALGQATGHFIVTMLGNHDM